MRPRADRWGQPLLALCLFVLVAVIAIGANPWRGQTSTPLDLLASYPGWGAQVDADEVRHSARSDVLDARLPQWLNARDAIRHGRLPLWDDTGPGNAALLQLSSGLLTPAVAIFVAAPDPATGFWLGIVFNLAMAGLGMFLFLRRHVAALPAVFGGVMFQLCGFNAAWLYWPQVLTLMWAPWLLWAVVGLVRRPSPGWFAAVAVFTAMVLLGGFPFVAELVLGAAGLCALVFSLHGTAEGRPGPTAAARRCALVAAALATGFLLVAIPLLTFVQWLGQFDTGNRAGGSVLRMSQHLELLFAPWAFDEARVELSMYVGSLGALLGIAGLLLVLFRRAAAGGLAVFALLLALVAFTLTFELVPVAWLAWVPGLGMNPWSRSIALFDLALATAAAVMLHEVLAAAARVPARARVALAVGCLTLAAQILDQLAYYRTFNGSTAARNFYPRSAVIEYVVEHTGPFDYVIADNAFMVSGTLGAYGIREWFAHRFKTPALRAALASLADDPFVTPTASSLQAANLRPEQPQMGVMNVRYLLLHANQPLSADTVKSMPDGKNLAALPPLTDGSWRQPVELQRPIDVQAVAFRLATYRARDMDGRLVLRVLDGDGEVVARVERDAAAIADNQYFTFALPEGTSLAVGPHVFELTYTAGGNARPLTAWAGPVREGLSSVVVDGKPVGRVIDYVIHARAGTQFRRIAADGGIWLWENTHSPGGPYFIADLAQPAEWRSADVELLDYRADAFTIRYAGSIPGFVVVPMAATDDWRVTVDGEAAGFERVLGVLPAVAVDGPAVVRFEYVPAALRWLWWWTAAVLAVAAGLGVWQIRRWRSRA